MKFRKKPVVIEAWENLERNVTPTWVIEASDWLPYGRLLIKTLEGEMVAEAGDWIIRGVKGEVYPCKADIFEMTYEPVNPMNEILGPFGSPREDGNGEKGGTE